MRTRAAARAVPLPPVLLDVRGYPHLFEHIIALAPTDALLVLRQTCRAIRERADQALLRHLVIAEMGDQVVVRTQDGRVLPARRWPKAIKDHVRILDFANLQCNDLAFSYDRVPAWITALENVHTVFCPGTACIGPPVPLCSAFVTSQAPFRLHECDIFTLRPGGRLVLLIKDKRIDADLAEFIREYGHEVFTLVLVFCAPDSRNRRSADVLKRILQRLGGSLPDPAFTLSCVFVNAESWTGAASAEPAALREVMRTAPNWTQNAEDRLEAMTFLSMGEYAETVGKAQFELEMQLADRADAALPDA